MRVTILSFFLLLSSSLLLSTVVCDPNHHHVNHNDFPWQNILSSFGIVVENQTSEATASNKEQYTSESTVEILNSEANEDTEIPVVVQNGATIEVTSSNSEGLSLGYKIGIPIVAIIFVACFIYCMCKCCYACCCGCCEEERPQVVVMQSNTVQAPQPAPVAPQIILQQPIIQQHAPPMYESQQRWAQPPHQGPPQWNQPPQGPPQWAPHPMGQQQHYSPNGGYDNAGFEQPTAPPPYNPGKY